MRKLEMRKHEKKEKETKRTSWNKNMQMKMEIAENDDWKMRNWKDVQIITSIFSTKIFSDTSVWEIHGWISIDSQELQA